MIVKYALGLDYMMLFNTLNAVDDFLLASIKISLMLCCFLKWRKMLTKTKSMKIFYF